MYSHIPDIHGIGIEATADKIGAALSAVTLGGVLAHAVVTNIQKRKLIKNQLDDISINTEEYERQKARMEEERRQIADREKQEKGEESKKTN